jgi:hypothetical protein
MIQRLKIVPICTFTLLVLATQLAFCADRTQPNILWISLEDITPMIGCH